MNKGNNTVDCGNGLEFYVSPSVLMNNDQHERTLKLQLQVNQLKTQQAKENIEIIPRAPSIVLSPKETKQLLAANAQMAEKAQARHQAEGDLMIPAPPVVMRDKQSFEIEDKLAKRPGVVIPGSGLTTSQRKIEEIQPAPPILLRGNESESASQKSEVPPPPKSTPRIVHNVLCFQSHIHNGVDEKWH